MIRKGSRCANVQENGYKISTRWYRTPIVINIMYPSSKMGWRCGKEDGTMLHVWCSCPSLQKFWCLVHSQVRSISTCSLDFTLAQFPLHHSLAPIPKYQKSPAMHMVNAARMCILVLWKKSRPPTLWDWYIRIKKICEMEELVHAIQETYQTF